MSLTSHIWTNLRWFAFATKMTAVLSVVILLLSFTSSGVSAQYELTGIPQNPTCDLCGKCRDAGGVDQKPADWDSCRKCLYALPNPLDPLARPIQNKTYTPFGCVDFDIGQPTGFVQTMLRFIMGIAGGLAFLGLLWGGFQLMTSKGDPIRVTAGRSMILSSIGAFLLIMFSVFLLQFIGVQVLCLPGFCQ